MASKYHLIPAFHWYFNFSVNSLQRYYTKLIIDHLFICWAKYILFENFELRRDSLYFKITNNSDVFHRIKTYETCSEVFLQRRSFSLHETHCWHSSSTKNFGPLTLDKRSLNILLKIYVQSILAIYWFISLLNPGYFSLSSKCWKIHISRRERCCVSPYSAEQHSRPNTRLVDTQNASP